ncbi:hypothetical protein GCM10028792_25140 [Salinisphaera aquimarina]
MPFRHAEASNFALDCMNPDADIGRTDVNTRNPETLVLFDLRYRNGATPTRTPARPTVSADQHKTRRPTADRCRARVSDPRLLQIRDRTDFESAVARSNA